MSVRIRSFDATEAPRATLADYHELILATGRTDRPGEHPQSFEAVVGRLALSLPGRGPAEYWAAYVRDRLIGLAEVSFPAEENERIAMVAILVHPDHRRQGTGTELLRTVLPAIIGRGRSVVLGWGVTDGGAGARFAIRWGFRPVHHDLLQVLDLRTVDRRRWNPAGRNDYHVVDWCGTAPAELLDSLAAARRAIADMPAEATTFTVPSWTPDRIRADEESLRRDGIEQRVVAAVRSADDTVAALTELCLLPTRRTEALQRDTAVLAGHRGRGLGRMVKSAMLRRLVVERPSVERVLTSTAAGNTYMINVNLALGFSTVREMIDVEADAYELCRLLCV